MTFACSILLLTIANTRGSSGSDSDSGAQGGTTGRTLRACPLPSDINTPRAARTDLMPTTTPYHTTTQILAHLDDDGVEAGTVQLYT